MFVSERGAPFTTAGFASLVERAGAEAEIGFKVHPHMLRHSTGYALANKGTEHQDVAGVLGPSLDPKHGQVHRARARPLQKHLAKSLTGGNS